MVIVTWVLHKSQNFLSLFTINKCLKCYWFHCYNTLQNPSMSFTSLIYFIYVDWIHIRFLHFYKHCASAISDKSTWPINSLFSFTFLSTIVKLNWVHLVHHKSTNYVHLIYNMKTFYFCSVTRWCHSYNGQKQKYI